MQWLIVLLYFALPFPVADRLAALACFKTQEFLARLGDPNADLAALDRNSRNTGFVIAHIVWLRARALVGLGDISWRPPRTALTRRHIPTRAQLRRRFLRQLEHLDATHDLASRLAARWKDEAAASRLDDLAGALGLPEPQPAAPAAICAAPIEISVPACPAHSRLCDSAPRDGPRLAPA